MDIINKSVNHKLYGIGRIIKIDNKYDETFIEVEFNNKNTNRFKYPDIFNNGILTPVDNDLKQELNKLNNEALLTQQKQDIDISNKILQNKYNNCDIELFEGLKNDLKNEKDIDNLKYLADVLLSECCRQSAIISNLKIICKDSLFERLINTKVMHDSFGEGLIQVISNEKENVISIRFSNGIVRKFKYPEVFKNELTAIDGIASHIIKNELIMLKEEQYQSFAEQQYEKQKKDNAKMFEKVLEVAEDDFNTLKSFDKQDFILMSNNIHCENKGHHIENIAAIIPILDDNCNIIYKKIVAGYCEQCNMYFILDIVYEKLKLIGVPYCKIDDAKHYYSGGINNGELAERSILNLYGYNVGQKDNLSVARRHNILASLIDNNVLSAARIINYLDYFIKQRQCSDKDYSSAIGKWMEDIEFLKSYQIDTYRQVMANSIRRKRN